MSGRTGLFHAWRMLDRHRNGEKLTPHQIEFALAAVESVTGRKPIPGSPTYEFEDEQRLREKATPH